MRYDQAAPERTFSKASLSEIEARAALQPPIELPVHPEHVGERNRSDSLGTYVTDASGGLFEDLSEAFYYDPSDGHESELEELVPLGDIVSTGHTVQLSNDPNLHANS